jgi:NAD(P)-dependent dehydrogenase (short-subunit alcohol dehydrogenase family)
MSGIVAVVAAGPGLGLSIARRFAAEGFDVALVARSRDRLAPIVEELTALGVRVQAVEADVADEASLRTAMAEVRRVLGDPDVLVYNASEYVEGRPTEVDYGRFVHGLLVGVAGALVAVQEVAPAMRARGSGTVLLTGSEAALRPSVKAAGLGVAKAGLRNLALSLAADLRDDGVHVTTVTIRGVLKPGTFFDPDRIAEHYWRLHTAPASEWEPEFTLSRPEDGRN